MIFLGKVCEFSPRENYTRVVVVVEIGYQSEVYVLRINTQHKLCGLTVGDCVAFTGAFIRRDGVKHFALDWIVKQKFEVCGLCRLPKTTPVCPINHSQQEVQLVFGQWKLIHRTYSRGYLNVVLENDSYILTFSSSTRLWFHKILDQLKTGQSIDVLGWKRKDKTDLIFIENVLDPDREMLYK